MGPAAGRDSGQFPLRLWCRLPGRWSASKQLSSGQEKQHGQGARESGLNSSRLICGNAGLTIWPFRHKYFFTPMISIRVLIIYIYVCQTLVWTMLDVSGKMRLLRLEAQDGPLRRGCASRHPSHCPGHTSWFVAQNVRKTGTRGSTFKKILGFRLPRG